MYKNLFRRALVFISFLVFIVCSKNKKTSDDDKRLKPNILWLVAEDLSPYIEAFGDSTILTPNISRLANEGVKFTNVYSPSPVCSPSRFAIATGIYPTRVGAHNMQIGSMITGNKKVKPELLEFIRANMPKDINPYQVVPPVEVKMHSEYLRENGYYCTNNFKEDYQFKPSPTSWNESSPKAHWRHRKENQPFFSIFNFMITHESRLWVKAKDSLWVDKDLEVQLPPYIPQTELAKQTMRRMYSNIKEMDYKVGEILKQLEEDGELENTIIFWYTDHGGPLPRQKRLLYDSGLNLPLIIRFPEKASAGTVDNQLISFVDFLPSMLSILEIEPPEYLDGQAFLGKYKSGQKRKYIHAGADRFGGFRDMIRAVRNERFKYLKNLHPEKGYYLPSAYREKMPLMKEMLRLRDEGKLNEIQMQWFRTSKPKEELFDCLNDPHELNNLANNPEYKVILEALRKECDNWMDEVNDKGFINEKDLINQFWTNGIQPQTKKPNFVNTSTGIKISTDVNGASIGYQIINKEQELSNQWAIYKSPVQLKPQQKLYAISHRKGYMYSDIVSYKE